MSVAHVVDSCPSPRSQRPEKEKKKEKLVGTWLDSRGHDVIIQTPLPMKKKEKSTKSMSVQEVVDFSGRLVVNWSCLSMPASRSLHTYGWLAISSKLSALLFLLLLVDALSLR